MSKLFLTIKTDRKNEFVCEHPIQYIFSPETKYIGFQICVRNDEAAENARTIYFYYMSDPKYFVTMLNDIH